MGRVIYLMNVSLDGYVETPDRDLGWTIVDDEVHSWFNDQLRQTDVSLYGRRLYEVMAAYWPTAASDPAATPVTLEFAALWNAKPIVVFSSTLGSVTSNSRLVRGDVVDEIERLKAAYEGDLAVGGPTLASALVRRGLVDEYRLVVHPVILGAGTPYFPSLETPIQLRPTETRSFESGVRYLAYVPVRE
jgi:dihydrofolate reductase